MSAACDVIVGLVTKLRYGVSFVEILRALKEAGVQTEGDWEIMRKENLVLWQGISEEVVVAIREAMAGPIEAVGCGFMVYMIDGCCLRLPIAKRDKEYKTPHWLPVTFMLTPEPNRARK